MAGEGTEQGQSLRLPCLRACLSLFLWISKAGDEVQMGGSLGAGWGGEEQIDSAGGRGVERIGKLFLT